MGRQSIVGTNSFPDRSLFPAVNCGRLKKSKWIPGFVETKHTLAAEFPNLPRLPAAQYYSENFPNDSERIRGQRLMLQRSLAGRSFPWSWEQRCGSVGRGQTTKWKAQKCHQRVSCGFEAVWGLNGNKRSGSLHFAEKRDQWGWRKRWVGPLLVRLSLKVSLRPLGPPGSHAHLGIVG